MRIGTDRPGRGGWSQLHRNKSCNCSVNLTPEEHEPEDLHKLTVEGAAVYLVEELIIMLSWFYFLRPWL